MKQIEKMFLDTTSFELDTPVRNQRTNHFYQTLNYRIIKVEDDFVYYRKDLYSKRFFKGNQFIFMPKDPILTDLVELVGSSNHQVLIKWSFQLIENLLCKDSFDPLVIECVDTAKRWAQNEVKMKDAKRLNLEYHQLAKLQNNTMISAIAQGCSVVHTPKHAMGLVLYELAWIYENKSYQDVLDKIECYIQTLQDIKENHIDNQGKWVSFLNI